MPQHQSRALYPPCIQPCDESWGDFASFRYALELLVLPVLQYTRMEAKHSRKEVAMEASKQLVQLALRQGSLDDISVVINLYEWA